MHFFWHPSCWSLTARFAKVLALILKASSFGTSTNTKLVADLKTNYETLLNITKSFVDRSKALQIVSFYETEKMDFLNFMVSSAEDTAPRDVELIQNLRLWKKSLLD